ncbi:MAG TPA: hypothetical protein VKT32_13430, partial [Chthonomonadaceae bacterium]|nr:hypothetical protein [Chthonomonadaceae bacterium]
MSRKRKTNPTEKRAIIPTPEKCDCHRICSCLTSEERVPEHVCQSAARSSCEHWQLEILGNIVVPDLEKYLPLGDGRVVCCGIPDQKEDPWPYRVDGGYPDVETGLYAVVRQ